MVNESFGKQAGNRFGKNGNHETAQMLDEVLTLMADVSEVCSYAVRTGNPTDKDSIFSVIAHAVDAAFDRFQASRDGFREAYGLTGEPSSELIDPKLLSMLTTDNEGGVSS